MKAEKEVQKRLEGHALSTLHSEELRTVAEQAEMLSLSIASPTTATFPPKPKISLPKSSFNGVSIQQLRPQSFPSQSTSFRKPSASVVMMAKKDEELKEIRAKTTEEINEEVVELKGELFILRLQKSVRNEFKSSDFRRMRKRVARMLTVKREREIEQGINKRLSRKLDRQWKKSIVVKPTPSLKKLREEEAAKEAEKSAT